MRFGHVAQIGKHEGDIEDPAFADKIGKRSGRIEALEFDDEPAREARLVIAPAVRKLEAGE